PALAGPAGQPVAEHVPVLPDGRRAGGAAQLQPAPALGLEPADLPGGLALARRPPAAVPARRRAPGQLDPRPGRPGARPEHASRAAQRAPVLPARAGARPLRQAAGAGSGRGFAGVHAARRERRARAGPGFRRTRGGGKLDRAMASVGAAIELQEVALHYGAFVAVEGMGFSVPPGQFLALVGPTGCGKSSVLNLVA